MQRSPTPSSGPDNRPESVNRGAAGAARRWRFAAALGVLVGLFLAGHRAAQVDGWLRPVIVVGPSMQPTLWGPSQLLACEHCEAELRFHLPPDVATPATLRCWNCGTDQPTPAAVDLPGDRVLIDRAAFRWRPLGLPLWQTSPQRGDLVAVAVPTSASNHTLQVKRILAVPGDQLSLRGNELFVNDRAVPDTLPQLPPELIVHRQVLDLRGPADAEPAESRWRWADDSNGTADPPLAASSTSPPDRWLVYHHQSVHDRRPDCIRDDYPGNVNIRRHMNPVERIAVKLDVRMQQAGQIKIMGWQSDQPRCFVADFAVGEHSIHLGPHDQRPVGQWREIKITCEAAQLPVDAQRPLAIAGLQGTTNGKLRLSVTRQLHWFVDDADRANWPTTPLTLGPGRYFIAGDNQPISIDSRAAPRGIAIDQVVGKVLPR